jgi:hypothetical protein
VLDAYGISVASPVRMRPRRFITLACVAIALSVTVGCKRDRGTPAVGTTTTSSAEVRKMTEDAVERIASAHCMREVACDHVGRSLHHASIERCYDLETAQSTKLLTPERCPHGVDQGQLVDCIAATENASCLDPIGTIERVEECKLSKLCKGQRP